MRKDNEAARAHEDVAINPMFARPGESRRAARFELGGPSMLPETAYQIVHDEAMLDGNARLNLATFVGTWMDDTARRLYLEAFDKNMIDKDEYPQTAAIEERCWRILAHLWNAPAPRKAIGCSTVGSSEACMLAGLALKRRWQEARKAQGKPTDRPNLVMSSAVQVVWEKFCNYWDIEARLVPITEEHRTLDGHNLRGYLDENTIGVVSIMGVTYTGIYEPVAQVSQVLDEIQRETGLDIPIHVDGASGAMVAPFLQPELEWDFRVPRVCSINTSGHKYGLVYPGVGWVVWRDTEALPDDLIFRVNYLGGEMPTFALNFSRPGAQVAAQYYNFVRLGYSGYKQVQQTCQEIAMHLSSEISKLGPFELLSDGSDLPVFAFKIKDDFKDFTVYDVSDRLRMRGWQVPAYTFPENLQDMAVLRIVIRNGFSMDLANLLLDDLKYQIMALKHLQPKTDLPPEVQARRQSFAH